MTTTEAIKQLQTEHDLIANEHELDSSQFAPALLEALAMAIEVLKCSEIPNCSEPKCADGCIYGWGSSECGHCDYRSEEPKTGDSGFITCMNAEKAHDRTTDDIISRSDLLKQIDIDAGEGRGYYGDTWKFIDTIKKMPSVQPEKMQLSGESTTKDSTFDCIGRQGAIDVVKDVCDAIMSGCESWYEPETEDEVYKDILEVDAILKCNKEIRIALRNMPSADVQPVVRCSECEHWDKGICYCDDYEIHSQDYYVGDMHTDPDFFCGFGKRKGAGNG